MYFACRIPTHKQTNNLDDADPKARSPLDA
jgi:hypothetical protein